MIRRLKLNAKKKTKKKKKKKKGIKKWVDFLRNEYHSIFLCSTHHEQESQGFLLFDNCSIKFPHLIV